MSGWSVERVFYEHPSKKSTNKTGSKTVCVKFYIDDENNIVPTKSTANPFKNIVAHNDTLQHAVITGLYVKFIQNDFIQDNIEIKISNLFISDSDNDEDCIKTDYIIPCPSKHHGLFNGSDEIIYKPTSVGKQTILLYAGQENILFQPTVTELIADEKVPVGSLFEDIHPLMSCLAEENFDTSILTKINEKTKTYYGVVNEAMERIKLYFNTKIFCHIHYTRFEECKFECNLKDVKNIDKNDGIILLLQINYVLTNLK